MADQKHGWIWLPAEKQDGQETELVSFRKTVCLKKGILDAKLRISADSRYKLYINGMFVEAGPLKGDRQVWYADELDVSQYLNEGRNLLAVTVLHYPAGSRAGNHGIWRTCTPGLYAHLAVRYPEGEEELLTDRSWKCIKRTDVEFLPENPFFAPLYIYEKCHGDESMAGWMDADYDDGRWDNAFAYDGWMLPGDTVPASLSKRSIPYLKREKKKFCGISRLDAGAGTDAQWLAMLQGNVPVEIPAHSSVKVEIDAGELTTGYLMLGLLSGKGAQIRLLQAECYSYDPENPDAPWSLPVKGDRTDRENGKLSGYLDTYTVSGYGTGEKPEVYAPFWFRTFRFIQLDIRTGEQPLGILRFDYEETGYPLEVKTEVQCSDETMAAVWDISLRSLKRCMHETYEDCPFYEQLQYAMDSRSQILYTYAISADDRLARKCMDDFRRSQREDGMINASYPCYGTNVIPGFGIYYIGMVYDHMRYFEDRELIWKHLPAVMGVLRFFREHLTPEGLVGNVGGLNVHNRYWSFIDWTREWNATDGVPDAILQGPITMESLLYILGLQYAAALADDIGLRDLAETYRTEAKERQTAVNQYCRGSGGMYQDGPGVEKYSQHTIVFAILTGTVSPEEGRGLLQETLDHRGAYAQCSVAMRYYLFRALEQCGLYGRTEELWELWRTMVKNHMTTCAEDDVTSRSDCHAWGALALYELPCVVLGVRPSAPGFREITVNPRTDNLSWANGQVITPVGKISVAWEKKDGSTRLQVSCAEGLRVHVPEGFDQVEILKYR